MDVHTTRPVSVLVESQRAMLADVLDRLIPSTARLPAAGALGVADYIDRVLAGSTDLRRAILDVVLQIDATAGREHSTAFSELEGGRQDAVLGRVEASEPANFQALLRQAYNGYYSDPTVITGLGLEARPPQPAGYELEAGDLTPLEKVKRRGRVYRDV